MGPLVAVGGIRVLGDAVGDLEAAVDALCREKYGFPPGEEFKWSPGRDLWMRDNLVEERRLEFFREVIALIRSAEAKATVVIEDRNAGRATDAETPELDVIRMCLERVCNQCRESPPEGLVITDRAIGGHPSEDKFLRACLENLQAGTGYLRPRAIALNVVSTPSKFVRLLQVADLVTGATLAAVGGERIFSVPVVAELQDVYRRDFGRVGGYGVKIHPDFKYANLHHWIFGDRDFVRFNTGRPLPMADRPYASDPFEP
jgi:hypothetical protein